jgi:hypothetical protein
VTVTVSDDRILSLIKENRILNLNLRDLDEAEPQAIAAGIALKRVYKNHQVKHAISFHRSIRAADRFREQQDALNRLRHIGPRTTNLHISSKKTAGQRSDLLQEFIGLKRALMTNARCLTEGIDVPAIDCVMFADPKQSRIDIVQAAGRALRQAKGKIYGYIVIPLIVPEGVDFDEFAEASAFKRVAQTITALSTQDERIADEFRAIEAGRISTGKIVEIEGDVPVGMKTKLGDFAETISTRLWESVGRANWRPFEDARAFVRNLRFKSRDEWFDYCASGKMPGDIPTNPHRTYAETGWRGINDWLGTGRRDRSSGWRPFKEARAFVHRLGFKSGSEWRAYLKSGKKPDDIPSDPRQAYVGAGWSSFGDWLGSGRIADQTRVYWPFKKARAFVHRLGLKSQSEWNQYCKSGKKPEDIPAIVRRTYLNAGWTTWGDWFGTYTVAPGLREYRSFKKAREFARSLGLKSNYDWHDYCKSGKKPADIPAAPRNAYLKTWSGWGDWLGTGNVHSGDWRAFKKARAFVRRLGLKSRNEWRDYSKSGKKPDDIPGDPGVVYAELGWSSFGDWLGTCTVAPRLRQYRSFKKARAFVCNLGLKSFAEWRAYCKSAKRPADIPTKPQNVYAEDGWSNLGDWLGTGTIATRFREYRSFKKARTFARGLGLKSRSEWEAYCKSEKKPDDIPTYPNETYINDGWAGVGDWLGYA